MINIDNLIFFNFLRFQYLSMRQPKIMFIVETIVQVPVAQNLAYTLGSHVCESTYGSKYLFSAHIHVHMRCFEMAL